MVQKWMVWLLPKMGLVTMSKGNGGVNFDDLINAIEKVTELARENEDVIGGIFGPFGKGEYSGTLNHLDPLKQVVKTEDTYEVAIEVQSEGKLDVKLKESDGHVVMGVAGEEYRVDVPGDADIYDADASLNNGVLTVTIPRTEEEDDNVNVTIEEKDEKLDESDNEEDE